MDQPATVPLDCAVIGAGPGGLTAATYLGRQRRRFRVFHTGESRAAWIPTSHNTPGFPEGLSGEAMLARFTEQASHYGADIVHARVEELRLIAPPTPPPGSPSKLGTGVGTTMTLSFRALPLLPLRLRWLALISEFEWNDHFCDTQTAGPFRYWRHCHTVLPAARDGIEGTVVQDRVDYELPGGPLGDLANLIGGRLQMRYIFGVRHRQAAKLIPEFAARLWDRT